MAPGEKYNPELVCNVRIGDVEVVLEGADADEAAKLWSLLATCLLICFLPWTTYVLLYIFLTRIHSTLAHLEAKLRRGVVDEATESGRYVAIALLLLAGHAMLLCVAISALWLRRRLRGRR